MTHYSADGLDRSQIIQLRRAAANGGVGYFLLLTLAESADAAARLCELGYLRKQRRRWWHVLFEGYELTQYGREQWEEKKADTTAHFRLK